MDNLEHGQANTHAWVDTVVYQHFVYKQVNCSCISGQLRLWLMLHCADEW